MRPNGKALWLEQEALDELAEDEARVILAQRHTEFRKAVEAAKVRIRARRAFWRYIRATPRRIWEYLIYV